jgi:hypothetical protein
MKDAGMPAQKYTTKTGGRPSQVDSPEKAKGAGYRATMLAGRASREAKQPQKSDQAEQPPTNAEKNLIAQFRERINTRHPAPRVKMDHGSPNSIDVAPAEGEPKVAAMAHLAVFGTTSSEFCSRTFQDVLETGCRSSQPVAEEDINGALAAMHGIAPRDELEGMLAAQMVAVHSAAMRCLRQLKVSEVVPQQDSNGNLAVKLMRTYAMQMETLQRYRGKGEQKMTVEHVHVYQGGQAIVGVVDQGGGAREKTEEQPHAPAITHEPSSTLPCPDAQREAVSVASSKR